jgi:hypothetical protein
VELATEITASAQGSTTITVSVMASASVIAAAASG